MRMENPNGFLEQMEFGFNKNYYQLIDKIDERIELVKKGEANTQESKRIIHQQEKMREISRLEDLKEQYKEAARKGSISKELYDERYTF